MRLATPIAVLALVGACTDDVLSPAELAPAIAVSSHVFNPVTEGIALVNDAGTTVRMASNVWTRKPFAGSAIVLDSMTSARAIASDGTVLGTASINGTSTLAYWEGSTPVALALPGTAIDQAWFIERMGDGELVIVRSVSGSTLELHRWRSSTSTWSNVGATVYGFAPATGVRLTAAGGLVWYRASDGAGQLDLRRTELDGTVVTYGLPPDRMIGAAGNTTVTSADADGRVVGTVGKDVGGFYRITGVLWSASGTPSDLPHLGPFSQWHGSRPFSVAGNYIAGIGFDSTGNWRHAVRWAYDGSTWSVDTFPAVNQNSINTTTIRVNANGIVAYQHSSGAWYVTRYGVPAAMLRDSTQSGGRHVLGVDAGNRTWIGNGSPGGNGYFTVHAIVSTPSNVFAIAGKRASLPVSFGHPEGSAAGPFSWSVQWNTLRNATIESGVQASTGAISGLSRIFNQAGEYTIRTIVTDAAGRADTSLTTATIVAGTDVPTAVVSGDLTVAEGTDIALDASGSTDPNGLALAYAWKFDGVNSTGATITRTRKRGSYPYRLIVTNNVGLADTASGTVVVENVAPTGTFRRPAALNEGKPFTMKVEDIVDALADRNAGIDAAFDCGAGYAAWGSAKTIGCGGAPDNGELHVGVKLRDQLGATTEYRAAIPVANLAPKLVAVRTERDGAGTKARLVYTLSDVAYDASWTATYQVNGVPKGTPKSIGSTGGIAGPFFGALPGDVLSVRVVDKDGKAAKVSMTVTP